MLVGPDKYCLEHVDIEVNHQCNLNCMHCSARAGSEGAENKLSLDELKNIIRSAQQIGLKKLGLTGGEPLLDIERVSEIAHFCRADEELSLHIHTNGTLIQERSAEMVELLAFFDAVSVTFLGADQQTHDEVTGSKEAFGRAFEGVRILVEAGLPLTCYFVPTRGRCEGYADLVSRLSCIGVKRIRALALAPSGRARPIYTRTVPTDDEIHSFEKSLMDLAADEGMCIEAGYCTRLLMPQLSVLVGHERCTSGVDRVHINFKGDVFPCTAASGIEELAVGNARSSRLEELWFESPLLKTIRRTHDGTLDECGSCVQRPRCRQGCLAYSCGVMSDSLKMYCPVMSQK
ncbi:radical SAM protein [Verrucomicrobiota bacterium]